MSHLEVSGEKDEIGGFQVPWVRCGEDEIVVISATNETLFVRERVSSSVNLSLHLADCCPS